MTEKLLTVKEVADILNFTEIGIYQAVFRKRLPCVKISKRALRFRPSDIQAFIESKLQPAEAIKAKQPVPRRKSRPRKNGNIRDDYIDRLVEQAKKEVGV